MKKLILTAAIISSLSIVAFAEETEASQKACEIKDKQEAKYQSTCPVMGGKINKDYYVDTDNGRVYFCCPGCISAFKKDPAKYLEKLKKEGVQLEKVNSKKEEVKENKE